MKPRRGVAPDILVNLGGEDLGDSHRDCSLDVGSPHAALITAFRPSPEPFSAGSPGSPEFYSPSPVPRALWQTPRKERLQSPRKGEGPTKAADRGSQILLILALIMCLLLLGINIIREIDISRLVKSTAEQAAVCSSSSKTAPRQFTDALEPGAAVKHIYVVGCGHSGTSVLKRTVANLPGLLCIPKESHAYIRMKDEPKALRRQLSEWDQQTVAARFAGWVEKSPSHINRLRDIFRMDPEARVVFIVRDGREVAASIQERGYTFEEALDRWVHDNESILPFLEDPRVLMVRFEDFVDRTKVLGVLWRLAAFARAPAPRERLLLALQPPSEALEDGEQCMAYGSEGHKEEDLSVSYLQLLTGEEVEGKGEAPDRRRHNKFRTWQASQAWSTRQQRWQQLLSPQQKQQVAGNTTVVQLLQRFGYEV